MIDKKDPNHFETRAERRARKRLERKQRPPRRRFGHLKWFIVVGLVVLAGLWWYLPYHAKKFTAAPNSNINLNLNTNTASSINDTHLKLVDSCTTKAATKYHIHSHLSIIIDGQSRDIPTDIGVTKNCLHPVHTQDNTGIIHVESPQTDEFTIADFFRVWNKEFTDNKILDQTVNNKEQYKLYADKKLITTGAATVMQDKVSYAIIYRSDQTTIKPPANYIFPSKL